VAGDAIGFLCAYAFTAYAARLPDVVLWVLVGFWLARVLAGRPAWLIGLSVWANWSLTLVASALGVRGLAYTRDPLNNVIAVLLDLFVVVPALVGAFAWAWGLGGRR